MVTGATKRRDRWRTAKATYVVPGGKHIGARGGGGGGGGNSGGASGTRPSPFASGGGGRGRRDTSEAAARGGRCCRVRPHPAPRGLAPLHLCRKVVRSRPGWWSQRSGRSCHQRNVGYLAAGVRQKRGATATKAAAILMSTAATRVEALQIAEPEEGVGADRWPGSEGLVHLQPRNRGLFLANLHLDNTARGVSGSRWSSLHR